MSEFEIAPIRNSSHFPGEAAPKLTRQQVDQWLTPGAGDPLPEAGVGPFSCSKSFTTKAGEYPAVRFV